MSSIVLSDDAAKKIATLLKEEGAEACVRIREYQTGTPCCRKTFLGLTIDEKDDDDIAVQANGLPFVISRDLVDQYGENFSIALDEGNQPKVTAQ